MKRTQLKRTTPLKRGTVPLKRSRAIAPVSDKRKRDLAIYARLRAEYLEANPDCCWPGCTAAAIDVHHAAGRVGERGERYLNQTLFRGLCRKHHDLAHDDPAQAERVGVSFSRLGSVK